MPAPTQATRHIAIETSLGEDVLLLRSFSGHEGISCLFEFDLHLLSEDYNINFDDIIGQNVTVRLDLQDGTRFWNGYISRFMKSGSSSQRFAEYRATMVPWFWFLTQTSDCRIFQDKTVPEIIQQVFSDLGFSDIEDRLSGSYRTLTYCVQYRETDFNFVSRLMQQEGIYYYFLHDNGTCTLVLCDSLSRHDTFKDYEEIGYFSRATSDEECITSWTVKKSFHSGKFAHTDYNFEKPTTSLMSPENEQRAYNNPDYEIYDYPGEYLEKADGEQYARVRMEELAQSYEVCSGESDSRGICPGYLFTLTVRDNTDLSLRDQAREYLVVSVDCRAAVGDYETSGGAEDEYGCSLTAIPSSVQFRPARITPKPVVEGTQTAIVTGPSGEEIYTDNHGRIKAQFHWDREGKRDENSSCWIRVSQGWAGDAWGTMHIPRIGQEVIVSFIEGDPDRPVVTGRLYNADNMPPYELPNYKNISTIKSRSTPQDSGYNELRFDDTAGGEQIYLHAQGSRDTLVNGSWREMVGGEKHEWIKASLVKKTEDHYAHKIGQNYCVDVNGFQQLRVQGNASFLSRDNIQMSAGSSTYISSMENTVVYGGSGLCLYVDDGNFITINSSGITIKGTVVNINSGGSIIPIESHDTYDWGDPHKASSGRPPQEPSDDSPPILSPASQPSQFGGATTVSQAASSASSSSSSSTADAGEALSQLGSGAVDLSQPDGQQEQDPPPSPFEEQSPQSTLSQSSNDSGGASQRDTSTEAETSSEAQGPQSKPFQPFFQPGVAAPQGISAGTESPSEGQDSQSTSSQSSSETGETAQGGISAKPEEDSRSTSSSDGGGKGGGELEDEELTQG